MEIQEPEHPVETIRHLAGREHDYVYSRSNYFILSESVLLTAFILTIDSDFRLAWLIYIPVSGAGLFLSAMWTCIGCQSQHGLQVVRSLVAKKEKDREKGKDDKEEGYEDKLDGELQVYKKFRDRRQERKPAIDIHIILLFLIPGAFLVVWGFMLIVSLLKCFN